MTRTDNTTSGDYNVELVAFHLTSMCTHACKGCYMDAGKDGVHASYGDVKKICDELVKNRVKEVTFVGGDPVTYPRLIDAAKILHDGGVKVAVLSNTHSYNRARMPLALEYIDAFETTIHSHVASKHDDYCSQPGAFGYVIKKLRHFSDHGKPVGIVLNLERETCGELYTVVEAMVAEHRLNVQYVILQRIIPQGRASDLENIFVSAKEACLALENLQRIRDKLGIRVVIEDPVPMCVIPEELHEFIQPCQWGLNKVSVNGKGDLSRCGADARYRLGNLLETPLGEIWNNSVLLKSFREKAYLPQECHDCDYLEQCGGGCPLSFEKKNDVGIDYLYAQRIR